MNKIKDLITSGKLWRTEVTGLEKVVVKGKEKPVEIYEIRSIERGQESKITECKEEVVVMKEK